MIQLPCNIATEHVILLKLKILTFNQHQNVTLFTISVLSAPCVPDQAVETNTDLDLPTGFDIQFPGSVLNDIDYDNNLFAILTGSQLQVKLR